MITVETENSARQKYPVAWQPILKMEHYRLKQDSVKHPVELKEDSSLYQSGGDK